MPVIIQSFDESAIRPRRGRPADDPARLPDSKDEDVTEARIRELAKFATGIAPEKFVIARHPEMVARAHAAGLTVTSWTFRADDKEMKYPSVKERCRTSCTTSASTRCSRTTRISFLGR
jgi:glycerophosphoryl diester phosphodiesterase